MQLRFKRPFAILALALGFCFGSNVQAQQKSLLWKVTGNGLSSPSYVYGTIHLICPTDYFLTDSTKNALDNTQQLYLELDMDEPTMMAKTQKMMMFDNGKKLSDYVSPEDYKLLDDHFKRSLKMSVNGFQAFKPLMVTSMMYMTLLKCPPQSYEMNFVQSATAKKKEVLGLETIESQMAVFDKIPYEKQMQSLVDMVKKGDESTKEFAGMIAAYKAQDLDALMAIMDSSPSNFKENEKDLLENRNTAWIPVMESAMKAKSTFFGVGAAHLAGKMGVLNLLKEKGYTVTPVK